MEPDEDKIVKELRAIGGHLSTIGWQLCAISWTACIALIWLVVLLS